MRFIVRPLRHLGRRLAWHDVQNGPAHEGDLVTYEMQSTGGRIMAATLNCRDPAVAKPLPDLYEPMLVGVSTLAFRLRGFERHDGRDGPFSVAQEWHCEALQPANRPVV